MTSSVIRDREWPLLAIGAAMLLLAMPLLERVLTNMPAASCIYLARMRSRFGLDFWWLLAPTPEPVPTRVILETAAPMIVTRYLVAILVLLQLAGALAATRISTKTRARLVVASLRLLNLAANEVGRPLRLG